MAKKSWIARNEKRKLIMRVYKNYLEMPVLLVYEIVAV